ncbi:MAG: hypothetical protein WBM87_03895 [Woeseiaceae bacterium]
MMEGLKSWFKGRFSVAEPPPSAGATGTYRQRLAAAEKSVDYPTKDPDVEVDSPHGHIESLGPGKNVLVRSPYVREDLGTHESLKIVDQSLVDEDHEAGIDPYNTGKFDKSRKWDQRFRK